MSESNNSSIIKDVFYHGLIIGMIGFKHYTSQVGKNYRKFFDTWVVECDKRPQEYYDCKMKTAKVCEESCTILQDVQGQLLHFKEAQSFDQNNLNIIKSSFEAINKEFTTASEVTKRIRNEGGDIRECIRKGTKEFEVNMNLNYRAYLALGSKLGGAFAIMITKDYNSTASVMCSAVSGALAGFCFTLIANYCNSYDEKAISVILKKATNDMLKLTASADMAEVLIHCILESIKTCLSSVEMSLDRIGHTKGSVVAQTNKIIEQVGKLEAKIKDFGAVARDNTAELREMIALRSSDDLKYIIS